MIVAIAGSMLVVSPCCHSTSKIVTSSCWPRGTADVHASRDGAPRLGQPLLDRVGDDDLAGLGLARHAVRGVHRGAEHVARLDHDRAEVAADPDRDLLALDLEVRVAGDGRLHLDRGVDRRVAVR